MLDLGVASGQSRVNLGLSSVNRNLQNGSKRRRSNGRIIHSRCNIKQFAHHRECSSFIVKKRQQQQRKASISRYDFEGLLWAGECYIRYNGCMLMTVFLLDLQTPTATGKDRMSKFTIIWSPGSARSSTTSICSHSVPCFPNLLSVISASFVQIFLSKKPYSREVMQASTKKCSRMKFARSHTEGVCGRTSTSSRTRSFSTLGAELVFCACLLRKLVQRRSLV